MGDFIYGIYKNKIIIIIIKKKETQGEKLSIFVVHYFDPLNF